MDDRPGQRLDAAREADQLYRAERYAELAYRMRWLLRLLAFFDSDRSIGCLVQGLWVGMPLIGMGLVRGFPNYEPLPWEFLLGLISALAALGNLFAADAITDRLRTYLRRSFEREGLSYDEPPSN